MRSRCFSCEKLVGGEYLCCLRRTLRIVQNGDQNVRLRHLRQQRGRSFRSTTPVAATAAAAAVVVPVREGVGPAHSLFSGFAPTIPSSSRASKRTRRGRREAERPCKAGTSPATGSKAHPVYAGSVPSGPRFLRIAVQSPRGYEPAGGVGPRGPTQRISRIAQARTHGLLPAALFLGAFARPSFFPPCDKTAKI